MSDRAGDILLIGGFLAIAWAWLRTRMGARGSVEVGMPIVHGPMPGLSGATGGTPDLSDGFSISAQDWPIDYFGGSFMPTATPPATQPAPPRVGSFGWSNFDDFARSATELDVFARTLFGEAGGEGRRGIEGVAAVVINRVSSRRYPNSARVICLQPAQFSLWNAAYRSSGNTLRALAVTDSDPTFRVCLDVAATALAGKLKDPTGGATLYYAPRGMIPPGSKPSWDFSVLKKSAEIGHHIFYVEL